MSESGTGRYERYFFDPNALQILKSKWTFALNLTLDHESQERFIHACCFLGNVQKCMLFFFWSIIFVHKTVDFRLFAILTGKCGKVFLRTYYSLGKKPKIAVVKHIRCIILYIQIINNHYLSDKRSRPPHPLKYYSILKTCGNTMHWLKNKGKNRRQDFI